MRLSGAVHGQGERYEVRLGALGFYVIDTEADPSTNVSRGAFSQKHRAREACDALNSQTTVLEQSDAQA